MIGKSGACPVTDTQLSTSTLLTILAKGYVGISTSTPGSVLAIAGIANFTAGTSTIYNNLNVQGTFKVGTSSIYLLL